MLPNIVNFEKQFHFISPITDSLGNHFTLAKPSKHLFQLFCRVLHVAAHEDFKVEATFLTDMKASSSKVNTL